MGTFKSLNEEPELLLNTGLSTFSPSGKCTASYFETQWPAATGCLAGAQQLSARSQEQAQAAPLPRPTRKKGVFHFIQWQRSLFCRPKCG